MAASGEVVEFGWEDADNSKPLSGRRKKALKEQKKKNKSGTFGEWHSAALYAAYAVCVCLQQQ